MRKFRMPSLGADMERGKLVEWYVKPGSAVRRGDIVALVETEKAAIEIEVFDDGVIAELLVEEGETVEVGTPIAAIAAEAEPAVAAKQRAAEREPAVAVPAVHEPGRAQPATPLVRRLAEDRHLDLSRIAGSGPGGRITRHDVEIAVGQRTSPRARRLAAHHGVNLAALAGTGPGGAVTGDDVQRAQRVEEDTPPTAVRPPAATEPPTPQDEREPRERDAQRQAAMRTAIGRLMARSKREIPHYYVGHHLDLERPLAWLEEHNARRSVRERILPAVLLLKATALAAREVPDLNGLWIDDAFQPAEAVHLGVAISLRHGGLIAPAIHDTHDKSLPELMAALRDLITRTRAGRLRASEMSDATLTVTNLGDQGVETVYGVIYAPQVALVGFGRILPRPWALDGLLGVRRVVSATVSADHRASDGHRGALLLSAIDRFLQHPEDL